MFVKSLFSLFALAFAMVFAQPALAAEPTMHEIYVAAQAGKLGEAQTMIDQVLRAHPNSAKAHYVQAELNVRQGKLNNAQAELATAERLEPGLPFAKPEAVRSLRAQFTSPSARAPVESTRAPVALPQQNFGPASSGMPWGMLLVGAGLVAFVVMAMRFMARRNAAVASPAGYPAYAGSPGMVNGGMQAPGMYPQQYPQYPQQGAPAGGGIGSGIMGGLATGAALGAGMVAGGALMRHFTDSNGNQVAVPVDHNTGNFAPQPDTSHYDMGGQDFGVADAGSSWDSGGGSDGGGGGDW